MVCKAVNVAKVLLLLWFSAIAILGQPSSPSVPLLFPDANRNPIVPGIRTAESVLEVVPEEVNSLSSIGDFLRYFDLRPKLVATVSNITTRIGSNIITVSEPAQELDQANCFPEPTVVPLELPQEEGVTYFPSCVRVPRCGGCCFLSHHSCQPTSKKMISVKVTKVQESATRTRRRRVRNPDEADIVFAAVETHLECDCRCRLQASDCNPSIHNYDEHQCACACKNRAAEEACLGSKDHFWSKDQCQCLCRRQANCSSGSSFDHVTCSCR